jgi:hypothetical protein
MSKRCAALDRWRRRTRKNRLAMPAPEAPLDWRKARAEPALPGRAENYRWWMDADWILVHDPHQARHVLGRSESPGILLRSLCDVSAHLADWRHVEVVERDMPECLACRGSVTAAERRGHRGKRVNF